MDYGFFNEAVLRTRSYPGCWTIRLVEDGFEIAIVWCGYLSNSKFVSFFELERANHNILLTSIDRMAEKMFGKGAASDSDAS